MRTEELFGKHVPVPLSKPKFNMDWPRNEPGRAWREAGNELSEPWYGPGCCTRSESNVSYILVGITDRGFFSPFHV
jgi:hypothetical protein